MPDSKLKHQAEVIIEEAEKIQERLLEEPGHPFTLLMAEKVQRVARQIKEEESQR